MSISCWKRIGICANIVVAIFIGTTIICTKRSLDLAQQNLALTRESIELQRAFSQNSLRPFLWPWPKAALIPSGVTVKHKTAIKCIGSSPAYSVFIFSILNLGVFYPEARFKRNVRDTADVPQAYIFPGDTLPIRWHTDSLGLEFDELLPELQSDEKRLYLHYYVLYRDFADNAYFLRSTWLGRDFKKGETHIRCSWLMLYAEEKEIRL